MKELIIKPFIYDKPIGILVEKDSKIYFEYEKEFIDSRLEISPIKMPLSKQIFVNNDDRFFCGLMGVFFDSLPDKFGNKIIENYYQKKGISKYDLSLLQKLIYMGDRAVGAIEYSPIEKDIRISEALEIRELVFNARKIVSGDLQNIIPEIEEAASSAGGVRAKAVIAINSKQHVVSGNLQNLDRDYRHYIIKFDGINGSGASQDYSKIEYLYMRLAKKVGINVANVELLHCDGLSHLLVERFDRVSKEKIHQHSLCGLTHVDFNKPRIFSYEDFLKVVQFVTKDKQFVLEAFKRMVFNIVGRNQDDHTKNFSFLMDKNGVWSLSPAYDLTYAFGLNYTSKHQMTINGKYDAFEISDVISVAQLIGIKKSVALNICQEINDAFACFENRANELGISKEKIAKIKGNLLFL